MKNLLTSLKKLGKKMTGSDVTGSDLVTVVDNIAEGYSGGGGSGGGVELIKLTTDYDDSTKTNYLVCTKTVEELFNLFYSKTNIIVYVSNLYNGVTINEFGYITQTAYYVNPDDPNQKMHGIEFVFPQYDNLKKEVVLTAWQPATPSSDETRYIVKE